MNDRELRARLAVLERRNNMRPPCVPLEQQVPFFASEAKYRAYIGGVGAGKTYAGAKLSHDAWIDYPGSLGVITAPTLAQIKAYTAKELFRQLGTTWDDVQGHPLVKSWDKTYHIITFINGSTIMFLSADSPDRFIGFEADWFWFDEPAESRYGASVFRNLLERHRGQVGPLRGWVTGTPGGFDWIHARFADPEAAEPNPYLPDAQLFHASTLANHHTPKEYRDQLLSVYGNTVLGKARLYGQFVSYKGAVFSTFSRAHHVLDDFTPDKDIPIHLSADFGVSGPTVWLWWQEYPWGAVLFDDLYVSQQPVSVIAQLVKDKCEGYSVDSYYGDIAGTQRGPDLESYVSLYAREGIAIETRPAGRIKTGVEVIMRELGNPEQGDTPRLFITESCKRSIQHLTAYHYPEDRDGNPLGDQPEKDGVNDHLVDTIRYRYANRRPELFLRPSSGQTPQTGGKLRTHDRETHQRMKAEHSSSTAQVGRARRRR